jgi:UDP:flavonoid glycosyltransferase YjiC (YdhE family)
MKIVLAGYGSRGDVEPCAAVGRELLRRGHNVCLAVPPNMIGFVESAGLAAIAYGPDSREQMNPAMDLVHNLSTRFQNPVCMLSKVIEHVSQVKSDKTATLTPLADGADLLVAGFNEQGLAANVAEYHGIPLAALHYFPERVWSSGGLYSDLSKQTDDAQRSGLGLPEATGPTTSLQIQAYDELCLPGSAAEWVEPDGLRPFVGALTLQLPTDVDEEVMSWMAAGTPPIYFGFGSTPLGSPAETVAVISAACSQLGERALICSGPNDVTDVSDFDHVKVVEAVNHATIFPACRAVVHHGGAGATAAGLRAGVPTLILWLWLDQPIWADAVEWLKVGAGRAFSASTLDTLVADLRRVLGPQYVIRAREVAAQMTKPTDSVVRAADLLEGAVRLG